MLGNIVLSTVFITAVYVVQNIVFYTCVHHRHPSGTFAYTVGTILVFGFLVGLFVNLAWLMPLN